MWSYVSTSPKSSQYCVTRADFFLLAINLETFMDLTTEADWYQLNRSLCCITHDKQFDCATELYLRIPRWCKVLATFFKGKGVSDDPNTKVMHANNHSSCISDHNVHWICNYSKY
jgi:hypothetical protein